MNIRNNNNGYKILKVTQESEPNGIGFRQLMRKTGLYQKSLSSWLRYLTIDLKFIKKDSNGQFHLTENAIKQYNTNNLIIPLDPDSKKFKKMQRTQFVIKEFGKNYAEIIILILCLAAFGSTKPREYKKPELGLVILHDPTDAQKTFMYGTNNTKLSSSLIGVGLDDLIDKLPNKSSYSQNKKAVLPKYYTNYENNELFGYLRLSKNTAQKSITLLSKEYNILSPIIKNNKTNNEIRYEICDELLKEFVELCILAFNGDVDQRLEYAYICGFLNEKQRNEYLEFLSKWYGRSRKYSNVCIYLNKLKDRGMNNSSKDHYRKYINECDKDIFHYELFEPGIIKCYECNKYKYKLIIGKKYKPLQEKYPLIVNIFFDLFFPQFLRKIWYDQIIKK